MARIETFFQKYARGQGVGMAEKLAVEIRRVLGVQAPIRYTATGKPVAATPAEPFAPPRRVSGALQASVKVHRTANGARVVVWKPYGKVLEKSRRWYGWPHAFVSVALRAIGLSWRS